MRVPGLKRTTHLTVVDHWTGLSDTWPIVLQAELRRAHGKGLSGHASLLVGCYATERPIQMKEQLDVIISEKVTRSVLGLLEDIPASKGKYRPYIGHTDDFPSIEISFETPEGVARFFTESQGEDHVPWGLELAGKGYVVKSPLPAQFLRRLDRYIGRKRLDAMLKQCWEGTP